MYLLNIVNLGRTVSHACSVRSAPAQGSLEDRGHRRSAPAPRRLLASPPSPGPANASRAAASEPVVRPARVMEIAYQRRSQSLVLAGTVVPRIETHPGLPRRRQDRRAHRRCRHHRQAGRPDRPARSRPTIAWPSTTRAQPSPPPKPTTRAPRPTTSAISICAAARAFTPQTLEQRQSLAATTLARSIRPGASSPRPRTTSPTPSCAPTPPASSPPCRPKSARSWRRARAWCAWRAPTSSKSWSACPSIG